MSLSMECYAFEVDAHFLPLKPLSLGPGERRVGYKGEQETEPHKNNHYKRDSSQYSVMTYMGKESKKQYMCN